MVITAPNASYYLSSMAALCDEDEVVYHEDEGGDAKAGGSTQPLQSQKKGKGKAVAKRKANAEAKMKEKAWEESMEVDEEGWEEPALRTKSTRRKKATEGEEGDEGDEEERPK